MQHFFIFAAERQASLPPQPAVNLGGMWESKGYSQPRASQKAGGEAHMCHLDLHWDRKTEGGNNRGSLWMLIARVKTDLTLVRVLLTYYPNELEAHRYPLPSTRMNSGLFFDRTLVLLFVNFWLCWVFLATCGLSLIAVHGFFTVVVVLSFNHVWFCNPTDCSTPDFPALHCLLEFAQTQVHWVGDAI